MLISPHVVRVDFGSHTYGYVFPSRGRKSRIHRLPQKSFPVERRIARKPDGCSLFPFSGDPLQLGQGQKLFDQPPAAVNAPKHISGGPVALLGTPGQCEHFRLHPQSRQRSPQLMRRVRHKRAFPFQHGCHAREQRIHGPQQRTHFRRNLLCIQRTNVRRGTGNSSSHGRSCLFNISMVILSRYFNSCPTATTRVPSRDFSHTRRQGSG